MWVTGVARARTSVGVCVGFSVGVGVCVGFSVGVGVGVGFSVVLGGIEFK